VFVHNSSAPKNTGWNVGLYTLNVNHSDHIQIHIISYKYLVIFVKGRRLFMVMDVTSMLFFSGGVQFDYVVPRATGKSLFLCSVLSTRLTK